MSEISGAKWKDATDRAGFEGVRVTVDGAVIDRAVKLLAGVEGGAYKAVRSAMTRATSRLQKLNADAVRERYALRPTEIRANENVRVRYSYQNGLQATVRFGGRRIPLYRFDGAAPAQPEYRTAARGHVLRETSPANLHPAFVAQMRSGHVGIFARTGAKTEDGKPKKSRYGKDEIWELYGPSVPQMLGNEGVEEKLAEEAMGPFEKDLDHEILAILSGYRR